MSDELLTDMLRGEDSPIGPLIKLTQHYVGVGFEQDTAAFLAAETLKLTIMNDQTSVLGDIADILSDLSAPATISQVVH